MSGSSTKTDTSATEPSAGERPGGRAIPGVVVVLEADRPSAGAFVAPLQKPLIIGRGDARRLRDGRLELPDSHLSGQHATLSREGARFSVVDHGSRNGTFVDGTPVTRAVVDGGTLIRVGHTFVAPVDDVGPALERARLGPPWPFVTADPAFAQGLAKLERVAQSPLPVLLLGETGTGKEVLARAIHERSGRPGPFVAVNCGALPSGLVEAQLFGHRKGAFSGATSDEPGFVRAAHGGTLFLDEIGDLPLPAQASLLRVLQEREVTPVGAVRAVAVDARVISATHQPLASRVEGGVFRADLLARLRGFSFTIPPLRDRRLDLGELIARLAPPIKGFRPDAALVLLRHDFAMNVRELKQALDVAAVLAEGGVVRAADLPESVATGPVAAPLDGEDVALRDELAQRLAATDRNVSQVARDMGKARQQVQRWMKRFGL